MLEGLPNLPAADIPDGDSEDDNREVRVQGDKPEFAFEPKAHFDLGEALGQMDFGAAARLSGARFVVLSGALARLERLGAHNLLNATQACHNGLSQIVPECRATTNKVSRIPELPRFAEVLYAVLRNLQPLEDDLQHSSSDFEGVGPKGDIRKRS